MARETAIGGEARDFPRTAWTAILVSRDDAEGARALFDRIACDYWKPLYHHLRAKGVPIEDAKDVVQDFFLRLASREFLGAVDPAKGRLRSYLKGALENHYANLRERQGAKKRGGGRANLPLDELRVANEPPASDRAGEPAATFEAEWALGVYERALASLRREFEGGRRKGPLEIALRLFSLGESPGYAEASRESGMSQGALKSFVHRTRKRYRELLLEEVSRTVESGAEVDDELAFLTRSLSR